jgi:hypothetical protein
VDAANSFEESFRQTLKIGWDIEEAREFIQVKVKGEGHHLHP